MEEDNREKKYARIYHDVGPYLGLGVQLAASIILMLFLGRLLDGKFNTYPVLTIIFSFLGGAAGMYSVIKTVIGMNRKNKIEKDK